MMPVLSTPPPFGSYRFEKQIGEGGMGQVWKGWDDLRRQAVAIKVMLPGMAQRPELCVRFKREASALARLHHPNVIKIYDYYEGPEGLFLVMEYVEGRTLTDYIQKTTGPIPLQRAWPLFSQILDALAFAHHRGVYHRDLKPDNIMIAHQGQQVKVLDFGIARIVDANNPEHQRLTSHNHQMGTVLYMSPEQITAPANLDHRSDIYALGLILREMITAQPPYTRLDSSLQLRELIVKHPLPPMKQLYPNAEDGLQPIVDRALAKDREQRYSQCVEFKEALYRLVQGETVEFKEATKPHLTNSQPEPAASSLPPEPPNAKRKQESLVVLLWALIVFVIIFLFRVFA